MCKLKSIHAPSGAAKAPYSVFKCLTVQSLETQCTTPKIAAQRGVQVRLETTVIHETEERESCHVLLQAQRELWEQKCSGSGCELGGMAHRQLHLLSCIWCPSHKGGFRFDHRYWFKQFFLLKCFYSAPIPFPTQRVRRRLGAVWTSGSWETQKT